MFNSIYQIIKLLTVCLSVKANPLAAKVPERPKLGFLLSTMQEERYQYDRSMFMEEAARQKIEVIFASSNNDHVLQYEKSQHMLKQGIKALVLQPVDVMKSKKIVKLYDEHNIPVIAYDRYVDSEFLAAYITHSNKGIGTLQAKEALVRKKDIRNVIICAGEKGHNVAMEITRANIEVLKTQGIEPIVVYHPKWALNQCKATVLKHLKEGAIDAILANNSQMAQGAIEAAEILGIDPSELFIAGADGTTQACLNLLSGKQTFDVQKPIGTLVTETIKVVLKVINQGDLQWKRTRKRVPIVNVPVYPLHKNNLQSVYQISMSDSEPACRKHSW